MTQEEKDLLLKDLCARLPYEPAYDCMYGSASIGTHRHLTPLDLHDILECDWLDGVRLYLRPLSSMTDEERKELYSLVNPIQRTDFYYSHHIDCRFMIDKGLALEAPEGMYNININ